MKNQKVSLQFLKMKNQKVSLSSEDDISDASAIHSDPQREADKLEDDLPDEAAKALVDGVDKLECEFVKIQVLVTQMKSRGQLTFQASALKSTQNLGRLQIK